MTLIDLSTTKKYGAKYLPLTRSRLVVHPNEKIRLFSMDNSSIENSDVLFFSRKEIPFKDFFSECKDLTLVTYIGHPNPNKLDMDGESIMWIYSLKIKENSLYLIFEDAINKHFPILIFLDKIKELADKFNIKNIEIEINSIEKVSMEYLYKLSETFKKVADINVSIIK